MITGYGVAEAVKHYYTLWGGALETKRAIIQGGEMLEPPLHFIWRVKE